MAKEIVSKGKSYKSIISINPDDLTSYKYDNNELSVYRASKFIKENFYISCLAPKDIISTRIEISKSIPDEDVKDAVELKVYDDMGLDPAVLYKIIYLEDVNNASKERLFDVYVVKLEKLSSNFEGVVGKIKYVDYISIPFFLPASLYKKNLLEPEFVDCFIYFQKNDAFLSIYDNGNHLYSKALRYSLEVIYEKFCESIGERIDEDEFFNLVTNDGLKSTNITQQQHLMKLFGEIFLYINDVIVFAKRLYKIEHIDNIYIGSEVGKIVGVEEYSRNYLGVESKDFNFSIAINTKEWYVDQIQVMMILTALDYLEDPEEKLNLSIIKRPPAFLKRASGQIITAFVVSVVLSFAYPAYNIIYAYGLDFDKERLNNILDEIKPPADKLRGEHNRLKSQIESAKKTKTGLLDDLKYREKILNEIHRKKVQYNLKSEILSQLFRFLNIYKVKIDKITGDRESFVLSVKAKEDRYITQFIKALVKIGRYNVHTEKIENSDPEQNTKNKDIKIDEVFDEYIYKSEVILKLIDNKTGAK